jgi:hypothetical protein
MAYFNLEHLKAYDTMFACIDSSDEVTETSNSLPLDTLNYVRS